MAETPIALPTENMCRDKPPTITRDIYYNRIKAFTLIELSVVLLIIGLIVGGVLVGRDLIASAEVRAQVAQLTEFNQAVTTFRQKYDYLPGDIPHNVASPFGFAGCSAGYTVGNGNGVLNNYDSETTPTTMLYCEPYIFFWHLTIFKLLREQIAFLSGHYTVDAPFPRVKLGKGGGIGAASDANGNLIWFLGITNTNTSSNYCMTYAACSTYKIFMPKQAHALDLKMDDGKPKSGIVTNRTTPSTDDTASNACITSVADNNYNISNNEQLCSVVVKAF